MSDDALPTVEYEPEDGYVKLSLRRPVNIYVPTEYADSYDPEKSSEEPESTLELEWVYGYRGRDCRNNIHLLASGEVTYFVAAVAVIYNPESNTQRHYLGHTDDIKCIAVDVEKKIVATGQVKGRGDIEPHVRIWDSETLETLHIFGMETFDRGANCISFSQGDGDMLAVIDDASEPRLSVWHWKEENLIAEAKASGEPILGVTFSNESPSRMVTSGKSHMSFWTVTEEGNLIKSNAIFGEYGKPKYLTTVASLPSGDVITGDSNGNILTWEQGSNVVSSARKGAHEGAVFSLNVTADGKVISAGTDKKIICYDEGLTPTGEEIQIPQEHLSPRVVVQVGDNLIIGTTGNSILKCSFEGEVEVVSQGHLEELWGLAAHPSKPHFVTAGQDGKIYYRNADSHDVTWAKDLEVACQSADIAPNNEIIAVGTTTGKWVIIDESQEIIFEATDGDEPIQMLKFSPNGELLAVGSRDNNVYVYQVEEEGKNCTKIGVCEGHSSFITHLDWSADNQAIRTNSGDYELLFWKAEDGSQLVQSEETKDIEWATNNCIISFGTVGIWPQGTDGTDINSANKAQSKGLLASGDDFGHVKLFQYPVIAKEAPHRKYCGHSSHVTSVAFFCDDERLLSAGGKDTATLQWKVVG